MQFNVGDRVVCVKEFLPGYNGEEGVVVSISMTLNTPMLRIKFDCDEGVSTELRASRVVLVDNTLAALSPVCRKIRIMEERWKKFQETKATKKTN